MNRKLHVGCSPLTGTIFAGTVLKDGRTWGTGKQDVTIDALVAVAEHATKFGRPVEITGPDGKLEYRITVEAFLSANKAMIGASHLNKAADTIDTIDTLRAQLAEAQRDSERLDLMIEQRAYVVSDPDCCDGYWLNYARPDGTVWTQATEHETPRAAIDAAKGESNG